MPVTLVSGHVWDNVMLNACAVKSVFTCFSIIFSQLVWRASCCSVDVFYTAIDCDVGDLCLPVHVYKVKLSEKSSASCFEETSLT